MGNTKFGKGWRPSKCDIGPYTLPILYPDGPLMLPSDDETECFGLMVRHPDTGDLRIEVQDGMSNMRTFETTVHEMIEAVDTIYELDLPHKTIMALSAGLAQALSTAR